MKKVLVILLVLIFLSAVPASAESPQPYQYALVKCSGLPVATLVRAEQSFDSAYGYKHQLTTLEQWIGTYEARVNEFASLLGCPQVLSEGQLTFWYKIYTPVYRGILE